MTVSIRLNVGDGLRLYPLGEFVHRYEQVSEATRGLFEGSDNVEALVYEWLGDGDGLKLLCWQMSLPSIELASFTHADNLLYISQCVGLVKALAKGFPDQRPQGRVMSTDSGMDLEEDLFPLVGQDALHEHSRSTLLVKFVTNGMNILACRAICRASVLLGGRTSSRR